ncbi:MAG: NAD(P)-dependent oxidoreductase, partial [Ignavibacteriaceae bacterium]|nr:NAD(P)-dependent oxidoreductase [Ignavibacteriaceae bacterium]
DENHLIQLLKMKEIFAAGLDVYVNEPNINIKFLKLSNVILAPHIGSATIETRSKMAELAVKNVINVLKGKKPLTPVV